MAFCNFHAHSTLSTSDSLLPIKDLVKAAKEAGSPAVCLSEHGHAASMPVFFKEAEKQGIKPILGMESYFVDHDKRDTEKQSYHLLITVQNERGYQNYLRLMYLANIPVSEGGGFYGRPRITDRMLFEHKEGLIVSSSCIQGPVAARLLAGQDMDAFIVAEQLRDNLDNFFIEIMPNKFPQQVVANKKLIELGRKLNIPVITTLDVHFRDQSFAEAYEMNGDLRRDITYSIRQKVEAGEVVMRGNKPIECMSDPELWYKTETEIFYIYGSQGIDKQVIEASLNNTLIINDMIDFKWENRHFSQPEFCKNADEVLGKLLGEKLIAKFGGRDKIPDEYRKRTRYEFDVIRSMGFSNYFLILHDAISYAQAQGVKVGPGRGSGAGCLLLWILDITKIDSLKYQLPFERFLNPERTNTVPDVDLDLEPSGREVVMTYLKGRYGPTNVCQVANHSTVKIKAALKDVGKWLEIPFKEMNDITSAIPARGWDEDGNRLEIDYDEAIKVPKVQEWAAKHPKLFELAQKLEGSYRQFGVHAGAFCILPEPAEKIIPVMKKKTDSGADVLVSQWDKTMLESVGIHKYDFLGLSTLSVLNECEKLTGIKPENIPLDDPATWKFFHEANYMLGIFQFIEDKTKFVLRDVKPNSLSELADVNTLIRPGSDLDTYLANKKRKTPIYRFDYPEVIEIVKSTYGAIIYQEQIMYLAQKLGGFTLGEGDLLRRALEKRDFEKIDNYRKKFVESCIYKEDAEKLFDWISDNADYGFNMSHALVYSLIGYQCAYYKTNYPKEFLVANLRHPKSTAKQSEPEYIEAFVKEAREMGIDMQLPTLGNCFADVTLKDGQIFYGLSRIKGISDETARIISEIEADNYEDFVAKATAIKKTHIIRGKESQRSVINKRHIEALVEVGFFAEIPTDEEKVNNSLGFQYYNKLSAFSHREDIEHIVLEVKTVKKGETNGRIWQMIKADSLKGEVTAFMSPDHIQKGDIILAKYRLSKNDTISITRFDLLQ